MKSIHHILLLVSVMCALSASAQLTFSGTDRKVITEKPEASSGLNDIFVVYDTQGVTATYTAKSASKVTFMRFGNLGGGHAEEIPCSAQGNKYSIALDGDAGYIVEEGTDRYYCWVVNYAVHRASLQALRIDAEQECDRARLSLSGKAGRIPYYTINGAGKDLSRQMTVEYNTLKFDEESMSYSQVPATQTLDFVESSIGVAAPLCDTRFELSADRFLKAWGMEESVTSDTYQAIGVEAHSQAEEEKRNNDNEQTVDGGDLGGSGPVVVHFSAAVTDAAIFREWQLSNDPEFNIIFDRFQQLDFDYTFTENGSYYVRFVANNASGTCEYFGDAYQVFVGESDLLCPNVFSPNGDGVNDEWKVSYKSIIDYECHIFNRWGQEIISMNNPAQGWDGKHKGKYVPTGVYYYVIKARGSDGRKYNLSGDINIIKAKKGNTTAAEN